MTETKGLRGLWDWYALADGGRLQAGWWNLAVRTTSLGLPQGIVTS